MSRQHVSKTNNEKHSTKSPWAICALRNKARWLKSMKSISIGYTSSFVANNVEEKNFECTQIAHRCRHGHRNQKILSIIFFSFCVVIFLSLSVPIIKITNDLAMSSTRYFEYNMRKWVYKWRKLWGSFESRWKLYDASFKLKFKLKMKLLSSTQKLADL